MRQRTELSEALSVASATDAHGSSIKEHQVSKRMKLSAIEQRDQISSSSQDQPARGKLLECLLQVKREHIESQCRKESNCEHGNQLLSLFSQCHPGLASFEYDPNCSGDAWTVHVLQQGTQVHKGRRATQQLQKKYNVDVEMKSHPEINAHYMNETVLWFSVGSQWSALLIAVSIYPARKGMSGCNELAHAPRLRCGCKQHPMMTSSQVSASCPCGFLCWRCLHRLRCMHVRIQMSSTEIVCMFIPAPPSFVMPLLSLLSNFKGSSY